MTHAATYLVIQRVVQHVNAMLADDVMSFAVVGLVVERGSSGKTVLEGRIVQAIRLRSCVAEAQSSKRIYCTTRNFLGVRMDCIHV